MPLDPSFVGRTYPPTAPYQVGREKIREFATAIGATDPAHHDPDAAKALGHPDVVAPPTFPFVITMAASRQIIEDPALGVDYSRVVHGDQRFAYTRPVVAGDELVCTNTIEDVSTRGGHGFLTTRTDVSTVGGEPVVAVWAKYVVRGES
ncbi:MaoC family dehydratase N-terminal domain-containing protein [Micromonospora sp. WMMD1120]|uniref:MaoC family dehydratase N-terminal domain-containing protein n=1 Tax=Micromonospora sp. WMMD1120 TaxID=3016106 RepID=UPI002416CF1E|nr:MaoC family dehydratase N-terminal domain-containing protein [Micromonospora sp. WMMD1120]MDG4806298.1 MaoC family dehydratase N-terminal domain-containing protein [Micromonospora sp. WMMD1120]